MTDTDVANTFANHFNNIYYESNNDTEVVNEFLRESSIADMDYNIYSTITVETIDRCIRNLKLHKASGPDDLSAEHVMHAHPSLIIHLKLLFHFIISHSFVPSAFGQGIIVPLVKDKSASINSISNYRPIMLTPVISKVFGGLLLMICQEKLATGELQFGFKSGIGCDDVIFFSPDCDKLFYRTWQFSLCSDT